MYTEGTISKIDPTGSKELGLGGAHNVEVMVPKQGAMYPGDKGEVQYVNDKGILFASQIATPFELPDDIEVKAGTHGKIDTLLIEKDDVIKEGQLIANMDVSSAELDLKAKQVDLAGALLTIEQKKREIEQKQVKAPISGVITKLDVKEGQSSEGSEVAAIIMDTSNVYFMAAVDEIDIPAIKLGQSVDVYVTAFGNRPFKGKVVEIPKEGTKEEKEVRFEVKVELVEASEMKHGMTGDSDIFIDQKENVLRLPLNAVEVMDEGKGTVMVKNPEGGEPMPKEVEVGIEGTDYVEIVSGLEEGEEVLLMGSM
jgi:HlyD family secretion protein